MAVVTVVVTGWAGAPSPLPLTVNGVSHLLPVGERAEIEAEFIGALQDAHGVGFSIVDDEAAVPAVPEAEGVPDQVVDFSVLNGTINDLVSALPGLTADQLNALLIFETSSDGKNRKGAVEAIEEAIAETAA